MCDKMNCSFTFCPSVLYKSVQWVHKSTSTFSYIMQRQFTVLTPKRATAKTADEYDQVMPQPVAPVAPVVNKNQLKSSLRKEIMLLPGKKKEFPNTRSKVDSSCPKSFRPQPNLFLSNIVKYLIN